MHKRDSAPYGIWDIAGAVGNLVSCHHPCGTVNPRRAPTPGFGCHTGMLPSNSVTSADIKQSQLERQQPPPATPGPSISIRYTELPKHNMRCNCRSHCLCPPVASQRALQTDKQVQGQKSWELQQMLTCCVVVYTSCCYTSIHPYLLHMTACKQACKTHGAAAAAAGPIDSDS
jgi:hypothetical protein